MLTPQATDTWIHPTARGVDEPAFSSARGRLERPRYRNRQREPAGSVGLN